MTFLIHLLDQYGYIVLFFSLMLELIIIPIPNEILMSYVGFLVYQGKLNLYTTIIFGGLGGIIGVTISYFIGYKLGAPFFYKYGNKFHMGPEKIDKISGWNKKYGKRLLLFSYFIPGVRHLTSLFSGITRVSFKGYAFFAYIGVYLWVGTFITLGKIFGPKWAQFHQESKSFILIACIALAVIYLLYYFIKVNREKLINNLLLLFEHTFKKLHSFLKIKILIFFVGIIFIGLFSLMFGLIDNFIENEFDQFNAITTTIIFYFFDESWKPLMAKVTLLTSWKSLINSSCLTLLAIGTIGKNKLLEFQYYAIGIIGAIVFGNSLHLMFTKIAGSQITSSTFPSRETLIGMVIFIFFMYAIVRHCKSIIVNLIVILLAVLTLLLIAISKVYLGLQLPNDIAAGYVFGGVWVSLMILLIEISRLLNLIKFSFQNKKV